MRATRTIRGTLVAVMVGGLLATGMVAQSGAQAVPIHADAALKRCRSAAAGATSGLRHELRDAKPSQAAASGGPSSTALTSAPIIGGGRIVVRVHAHVLRTASRGFIASKRVQHQVSVLRNAFAGRQSANSADTRFRFRLVSYDVTVNPGWWRMSEGSLAERRAKRSLHRGKAGSLNLYFVAGGSGSLGWATPPSSYDDQPLLDGVVIPRHTLPGKGGGHYSDGDATVHEVGHWLGLLHTFAGRCGRRGDRVADTPPERRPSYTCPVGRDTCSAPGRDPVHNFMDYSYDSCMDQFTRGQSVRMTRSWFAFRAGG